MAELTDEEYRDAVELCRGVVGAATGHDASNTAAGSLLGALRLLLRGPVVREQWVVFYGGPDPENFAGRLEYDDPAEAEEMQRWIDGSGVARRHLYAGPWQVTHDAQPD